MKRLLWYGILPKVIQQYNFFFDARLGDTQEKYLKRVSEMEEEKKNLTLEKLRRRSVRLLSYSDSESLASLKVTNQEALII